MYCIGSNPIQSKAGTVTQMGVRFKGGKCEPATVVRVTLQVSFTPLILKGDTRGRFASLRSFASLLVWIHAVNLGLKPILSQLKGTSWILLVP